MHAVSRSAHLLAFLVTAALSAALSATAAQAAPQIVAAVPTGGDAELVCAGGNCSAEFSAICLQQGRTPPSKLTPYVIHGPDRDAITVTGYRKDGGTVTLAPGILRFASLRGHSAFRTSVPAAFLKSHGLDRLTVRIGRLAMLMPVAQAGDPKPQTAEDVALASRELKTTGAYWTELNPQNLAMARLTNRIINRLPARGSVPSAVGEALWQQAATPEKGLSKDSLAWNRSHFDYCRENALNPGSFSMRRCLGVAHDWFMKDLNVNYWNSLKPQS